MKNRLIRGFLGLRVSTICCLPVLCWIIFGGITILIGFLDSCFSSAFILDLVDPSWSAWIISLVLRCLSRLLGYLCQLRCIFCLHGRGDFRVWELCRLLIWVWVEAWVAFSFPTFLAVLAMISNTTDTHVLCRVASCAKVPLFRRWPFSPYTTLWDTYL